MVFITSLIEELVGCDFNIECYDIEVHGELDHHPPLYKGPGIISGKEKGLISFKLHNQISVSTNLIRSTTDKNRQVRIFAKDYEGIDWVGGWSIPSINILQLTKSNNFTVQGQFNQLSARVKGLDRDNYKNTTELIFSEIPNLPFTEAVEEKRLHRDQELFYRRWLDRHELNFKGSKIRFFSGVKNLFYIVAENNQHFNFSPPNVENWIPEALTFIMAKLTYPRMIIRHFQEDSLLFLRHTHPDIQSGMPQVILGYPDSQQHLWKIFECYLEECINCNQFEPLTMTKFFSEVILSSTGTLQAFMLSLAVSIENIALQLFEELPIKKSNEQGIKSLKNYLQKWDGDQDIKNRAIGLLSMFKEKSARQVLKALKTEKVLEDKHLKTWSEIRNLAVHGGIINVPVNDELLLKCNLLISLIYRLILRKIGYKGLITDHSCLDEQLIDFVWSDKNE